MQRYHNNQFWLKKTQSVNFEDELDNRGVGTEVLVRLKIIFPTPFRPAPGPTHPPIQWVPGAQQLSNGVLTDFPYRGLIYTRGRISP